MPTPDAPTRLLLTSEDGTKGQVIDVDTVPNLVRLVLHAHAVEVLACRVNVRAPTCWSFDPAELKADLEVAEYGTMEHVNAVAARLVRRLLGGPDA